MNPALERFGAYLSLTRMDRPIGTLLLLWPTLTALWLASGGVPEPHLLLIFVLGTLLTRSAGCAINDYADRNLDGGVARTRARPLVTGTVKPNEAILVSGSLALLAFVLVLFTNTLTIMLSFGGAAIAFCYPFMKRHTHLPQLVLGAAFSWGIPMAFAAARNEIPVTAWLLFTANLLWTVAYDTQYAMVDRDDDLRVGIKSTAILFGQLDRAIIAVLQGMTLLTLLLAGQRFELSAAWYYCLLGAGLIFLAQFRLTRSHRPEDCFRAFLTNNYVGAAVFAGAVIHFALYG
jgi:4-hydroxybenzoate polyprenyltransferase